jgi:pimeloyl-ACP methyl ester carboxylesterase
MGDICSAYFKTKDGVRLHYLEAGAGPTLIILPGWTQPAAAGALGTAMSQHQKQTQFRH